MQQSPYEEIATTKKVPSSTKILELLGKSDIVKERYNVSTQPYSGQGAGIGAGLNQKITFKLFNNADYADLSTAYLTFQAQFSNATAANLLHLNAEDNVLSWFNLVRTLVNDQVVEEISNFNIWANLITYASMSKSYYETAGSFMGCYRHSKYLVGGARGVLQYGATPTPLDFGQQAGGQQQWEQLDNGTVSWVPSYTTNVPNFGSGGNDSYASAALQAGTNPVGSKAVFWSAPLAGYLGIFSLDKYFPLRSVSSITLELNLPTNIYGVVFDNLLPSAAPSAGVAATTLQLNNMYIHYDCVKMSDAYYDLMDQELLDPNGLGVQYTINTVESVPVQIPAAAGAGQATKKVLVASKGTRYLKSFWSVYTPNFTYNSGNCPPSSVFIPAGFQSAQLVVNSKRFPQYNLDSYPRAYQELMKSCGKYHSVVGDSVITYPKYSKDLSFGANNMSGIQNLVLNPPSISQPGDTDCEYSTFILGTNLEQVLNSPEIDLQGENTLTAGFQIQLELTSAPPVACTGYLFPHFAKVLRIKGGSVAILN